MLLTGWKEISTYLRCGVRTAQRWEHGGLPVNRPLPGRRSHVVAESENLDLWLHHSVAWRRHHSDFLSHVQQTRKLRDEIRRTRDTLQQKLEALNKEVNAVRKTAEQLQRDHPNARNQKAAGSSAA